MMRQVAVVGPGRVGTALAMALERAGDEIVAVAGRTTGPIEDFCSRLPGAAALPAAEATHRADLVLVCVPDDALAGVVRQLARDEGVRPGSRWVHTSGGHGTSPLHPVALAGARVAACHPAQTFPDPDQGLASLPGTSWAITAPEEDLGWARVLVTDLGGRPVAVPEAARTLYHTGLTVGSNATASVVILARDLLLGAGVADPNAFLGPLVTTSASNAAEEGEAALTGPVRRGDAGTVAAHLAELRAVLPEAVDAYLALARLALRQARRAGLPADKATTIEEVLNQD